MFLKRLYSEPSGLFRSGKPEHPHTIVFKEGFNFIFGKKENQSDSKDSLNGLGKSTVCDLIDFCLLADFNSKNSRFFKEKQRLENYTIVLEFEVQDKTYIIKRSAENHLLVTLGVIGEEIDFNFKDAKNELLNIIFDNPNYSGILKELSYRILMTFFMKVHKKKNAKGEFSDPINFLTNNNALYELLPYHFFLLGFDNSILYENANIQKILSEIQKAISQVKNLFKNNYSILVNEVDSKLSKLRNEAKKIRAAVEAFKLAEQHKDIESKLNELTGRIKFLSEQNFWLSKKVKSYKDSFEIKDNISDSTIRNIDRLYAELNQIFQKQISKSLKEAVDFRKKIAESRKDFLKEEIQELEATIKQQEKEIQELDTERQKLFGFLKSKEAFKDLTEAFYLLGEKEKEISDLEGKIKIYNDLQKQKTESDAKDVLLKQQAVTLIENLKNGIDTFEALFSEVYRAIYPVSEESGFSIRPDYEGKNKVDIDINFEKDESKGWNKGRTLVYDIAIMINTIQKEINAPKFLIHDGIFDGMDKAHFVSLYHYIQSLQSSTKFQYIVTMIEEGELKGNFGKTEELTPEKIAEQAIVVLSKNKPLWI